MSGSTPTPSFTQKEAVQNLNERIRGDKFRPSYEGHTLDRPMSASEKLVWEKGGSPFNYYAGYYSNSAMVLFLLSCAFLSGNQAPSLISSLLMATSGLFGWTFIEYWFHRFPYHHGHNKFVMGHLMHHEAPRALIGIPYYITAVSYIAIYYLLSLLLDPAKLAVFMAFFWLGYIGYCGIHHGIHHWAQKNRLYKIMKAHHIVHHNHPDKNFSITFPPWDFIFRTKLKKLTSFALS